MVSAVHSHCMLPIAVDKTLCTIGSLIFKGTASGIFQIYHGKSHDLGLVVAMIQVSYTMPTFGVSLIHSAITINPSGYALGINSYCFVYS